MRSECVSQSACQAGGIAKLFWFYYALAACSSLLSTAGSFGMLRRVGQSALWIALLFMHLASCEYAEYALFPVLLGEELVGIQFAKGEIRDSSDRELFALLNPP